MFSHKHQELLETTANFNKNYNSINDFENSIGSMSVNLDV